MMDADYIAGLVDDLMKAMEEGAVKQAFALAGQIRGHCMAEMNRLHAWQLIREAYEAGEKPQAIALRFPGYTSQAIRNKASKHQWKNPAKVARSLAPDKKETMRIECYACGVPFLARSGHAKVCPTCKAFELEKKQRGGEQ